MKARIYRNLDRQFAFAGIRGRYLAIAGLCVLVVLAMSIIIGSFAGTLVGILAAVILLIVSYLLLVELQQRYGEKMLGRVMSMLGLPKFIIVRSHTWKR